MNGLLIESNFFIEYEWFVVRNQFLNRIWMVCCLDAISLWNMNGLLFESNLVIEYEWSVAWIQFVYRIWMVCCLNPICLWYMNGLLFESNLFNMNGLLFESNLFMEYEWSVVWIQFVYGIWMVCCLNPICL